MKINRMVKWIGLCAVVTTLTVGCSAKPKPEEPVEPAPAPTAQPAPAPQARPAPAPTLPISYMVQRGDNLWNISARAEIYGNPYMWPLIFRANRDQIRDADLIFPGQRLAITRDDSRADVEAAIRHARTRGAWTLGVVEASDQEYLRRHGR